MKPAANPGGLLGRVVVGALLRWVRVLPSDARGSLAAFVGWVAWVLRIRRGVVLDNLGHAYPEKTLATRLAIARGAYRNLAQAAVESVTSDLLTEAQVEAMVEVVDWRGLDVLIAERRPVLIASAHFGSWELFAELMSRRGVPLSAVVRPLTGAFNAWVVRSRGLAGVELILQRGALAQMLKALKRNRVVVQLVDQVLPAKQGVFVRFFGRLASTTPALSMAAIRSKAPVYVVLAAREGKKLRMFVEGPVEVPAGDDRRSQITAHMADITARIEAVIRRYPEQWLWLHRRWKVKPP